MNKQVLLFTILCSFNILTPHKVRAWSENNTQLMPQSSDEKGGGSGGSSGNASDLPSPTAPSGGGLPTIDPPGGTDGLNSDSGRRSGGGGGGVRSSTDGNVVTGFQAGCSLNSSAAQAIATDRGQLRAAVDKIAAKDQSCKAAVDRFQQTQDQILGRFEQDSLSATRSAQALKNSILAWQAEIKQIDAKLAAKPGKAEEDMLKDRKRALSNRVQDAEADLVDNAIDFEASTPHRQDQVKADIDQVANAFSTLQNACPNSPQVTLAATQAATGIAQTFGVLGATVAAVVDSVSKLFSAIVDAYKNKQLQVIRDTLDEGSYPGEIICAVERITGQYCNLKAQLSANTFPAAPCQLSPSVQNLANLIKGVGQLEGFGTSAVTPTSGKNTSGAPASGAPAATAQRVRGSAGSAAQLGRTPELAQYLSQLIQSADDLAQTPATPENTALLTLLKTRIDLNKKNLASTLSNPTNPSLQAIPNQAEDAKDLLDAMTQFLKITNKSAPGQADALVINTVIHLVDKTNLDFKTELSASYLDAFSNQLNSYVSGVNPTDPAVLQNALFSCEKNIESLSLILGSRQGFLGWKAPEFALKIKKFLGDDQSDASHAMGRAMCGASLGLFNQSQAANTVPGEVADACKNVALGTGGKYKFSDLAQLPFKDRACYAVDLALTR